MILFCLENFKIQYIEQNITLHNVAGDCDSIEQNNIDVPICCHHVQSYFFWIRKTLHTTYSDFIRGSSKKYMYSFNGPYTGFELLLQKIFCRFLYLDIWRKFAMANSKLYIELERSVVRDMETLCTFFLKARTKGNFVKQSHVSL